MLLYFNQGRRFVVYSRSEWKQQLKRETGFLLHGWSSSDHRKLPSWAIQVGQKKQSQELSTEDRVSMERFANMVQTRITASRKRTMNVSSGHVAYVFHLSHSVFDTVSMADNGAVQCGGGHHSHRCRSRRGNYDEKTEHNYTRLIRPD
jgi:hypothetical protein